MAESKIKCIKQWTWLGKLSPGGSEYVDIGDANELLITIMNNYNTIVDSKVVPKQAFNTLQYLIGIAPDNNAYYIAALIFVSSSTGRVTVQTYYQNNWSISGVHIYKK